jgi:beta-lactamase class D
LALVPVGRHQVSEPAWEQAHSLDSAMKWSALLVLSADGAAHRRERMLAWLTRLHYGTTPYEGEQTMFLAERRSGGVAV